MKFMHIGDLHLGKKINGISLEEDQTYALNQLFDIAKNEKVNCVLIAGDVYDKAAPPNEAYVMFDDFLTKLVKENIQVYMISGNHDASEKISYFSYLLKTNGVYTSEKFNGKTQVFDLEDEYGIVHIHLLPFIRPSMVSRIYPDEHIHSFDDAYRVVIEKSNINYDERNILVSHQFFQNAEMSGTEEMNIGGLDQINGAYIENFDYCALGHIHKNQHVGKKHIRYSGSLLKYSFSEMNQKKGPLIVEIKEKGDFTYKQVEIDYIHELREVKGYYEDIINEPYSEDFMRVILTNDIVPIDAKYNLLTIFPNMIKFMIENTRTNETTNVEVEEKFEKVSMEDLFVEFFKIQNNDVEPSLDHMEEIRKILKEMEENK